VKASRCDRALGSAAVRGDAPAPRAIGCRTGKAAREGAPSQKASARPAHPNPSRKGGFVFRSLLLAALVATLLAVQPASAATPHRIISLSPTATESLFAIGA